jgi:carbamoyltransferase
MEREGKEFRNQRLRHTYYGTGYTDEQVVAALEEYRLDYQKVKDPEKAAADLIAEGKVVGWFQGRLEFGPRALGNRSVLADPRNEKMKDKINKYLKKRDWFMPFAPSILSEAKEEYLEDPVEAPFMIMGFNLRPDKRKEIPAVVHIDGTVRPQTVLKEVNPAFWHVIKEFEKRTGVPVLLNTSFNRHGQPMVRSPEDAALHVVWGCVEYLIIHRYLVDAKVKLEE